MNARRGFFRLFIIYAVLVIFILLFIHWGYTSGQINPEEAAQDERAVFIIFLAIPLAVSLVIGVITWVVDGFQNR